MRYRKDERGFTLIELMATLVILALIIAIAVPAIGKLVTKANDQADQSSIALMERAGEMAELDGLKFDDENPAKPASITEKEVYMIPTLIEQGYLKLDDASKFNKPENYVKKVNKSGKFIYMGKGNAGGGQTPEPEATDASIFTWEPVNGVSGDQRVTGFVDRNTAPKEIVIPSVYNGERVTEVGNGAFAYTGLTSVYLTNNITLIHEYAFVGNPVRELRLSDNLLTIGAGAFNQGNALASLVVPEGVVTIGDYAFQSSGLTSLTLPSSLRTIGASAFQTNSLTTLTLPNVTTIGDHAFESNRLSVVRLPNTVTTIGQRVFNMNEQGFTLQGTAGSLASDYAVEWGYTFEAVN